MRPTSRPCRDAFDCLTEPFVPNKVRQTLSKSSGFLFSPLQPMSKVCPVSQTVLQRVAAGDATAVDECLSKYGGLVWSLARRFSINHAEAEDAVQEVFIHVWRNAARFDPQIAAESTFITMIARRKLIDRQRKRSRRPETTSLGEQPVEASAPREQPLEVQEEVERVRQQMQKLRPEERQVLELSISQGLSQREIAERTQMPLGSVKTHARRGLIRLRRLLGVSADERV